MPMAVPMNVLFVVAEMSPLAKVGGVGDVGGALPRALRRLGLDARVALPYYRAIRQQELPATRIAPLPGGAAIWQAEVRDVPVLLVEHEPSFDREQVYGYEDDTTRFLAFSDALLASAERLGWRPDVLHLNDWHAGFLAARLAGAPDHPWADVSCVCTVHNLGYTGRFDASFAREHGLAPEALAASTGLVPQLAYSALAQAILRSDLVTTVSPTYAREVLTPEFGGELTPLLQRLGDQLVGIMNGIDHEEYDPASDPHLAARFDADRLDARIENKCALQERLGLPVDEGLPLVGMVSRLFEQKGPDLAASGIELLLSGSGAGRFQFAVLGQGDQRYERALLELAARYPEQVAVRIAFDPALGQLIYGGCDCFLMPSRYEPCGLGQLIAMRYGAVPVVRRTGGLADSVAPYDPARERGTGFLFDEPAPAAVADALSSALAVYRDRAAWRGLQLRCLAQDHSWERAASEYGKLYRRAVALRSGAPAKEGR